MHFSINLDHCSKSKTILHVVFTNSCIATNLFQLLIFNTSSTNINNYKYFKNISY